MVIVSPVQPVALQNVVFTSNVKHLLVCAEDVARRHKSSEVQVKHLLVALINQFHGFGGIILKDLLREQKRNLDLWSELLKLEPVKDSVSQFRHPQLGEELEWVFREAAYIAKEYPKGEIGSGEVLLAVARLLKKPDKNEFPAEVTNSVHFQEKVNHVAKKFIFHSNALHLHEMNTAQKLLGLTQEELEEKVSSKLKSASERYRFFH